MSPDPHPLHEAPCAPDTAARADDADYWYSLITEKPAGEFCHLTDRAMQKYRQTGDGPRFVRISSRCIRYRRIDLRAWIEARLRNSTSDDGKVDRRDHSHRPALAHGDRVEREDEQREGVGQGAA